MDKISQLPDESLIKILSFLPTKVAVSTTVLSKRWECLWMWLPKLEYDDTRYSQSECERLRCFIHRSLPLHKAPVIKSLRLKFSMSYIKPEDINMWVLVAASRCVRELEISFSFYPENPIMLPSSLYANKSLVILKLKDEILLEVPRNVCLPSLKTLQLQQLRYMDEKSLQRLLSICPVLEDLLVDLRILHKEMKKFNIFVPSLKRLTIYIPSYYDLDGFVIINTPSLEYFTLCDQIPKRHYYVIENMPKLVEANIFIVFSNVESLIGSITSVKHLTLYLNKGSNTEAVYGEGFVFNRLEHLKISVCKYSLNLIVRILKESPNLRVLNLFPYESRISWNEQTMAVPELMLSSLQIFKWSWYSGSPAEKDFAVYILENARRLKTATISSNDSKVSKLEMLKELALSSRASATCKLVFN